MDKASHKRHNDHGLQGCGFDHSDITGFDQDIGGRVPTSTTITSLTAGDKYHVTVVAKAVTNSSASTKSATFTARTKPATPAAPTTPALTVGNKEVGVHWIKPATNGTALTHFVIEAISPTTTVLATKTVGVASTTVEFTSLTNGHAYKFKVAAQNAAGTSTFSLCFEPIGHAPYKDRQSQPELLALQAPMTQLW